MFGNSCMWERGDLPADLLGNWGWSWQFGWNQEHNEMQKKGLKLGIHLLALPTASQEQGCSISHSKIKKEIQVPSLGLNGQGRGNRIHTLCAFQECVCVARVVWPALCSTFPSCSVPLPGNNPTGSNGTGLTLQAMAELSPNQHLPDCYFNLPFNLI